MGHPGLRRLLPHDLPDGTWQQQIADLVRWDLAHTAVHLVELSSYIMPEVFTGAWARYEPQSAAG